MSMRIFSKLRNVMKRNWRIVLGVILAIIMLLLVIPLIINNLYKIDLGIKFFQSEWKAGEALAFYGSVLSGLLTFFGVLLTIRHEEIERKKEDSIKYKPILELQGIDMPINCAYREVGLGYGISICNNNPNKEALEKKYLENQCGEIPKYKLCICNVGRGETFNAKIEKFEIHNVNWEDISNISSNISTPQYIGEIIQDRYIGIGVKLPEYLILPKRHEGYKWFEITTKLYVNYSDMFDRIKYQYILYITHKVIVDNVEVETPDISNSEYQYVKVHYEPYRIMPEKKVYSNVKGEYVQENKFTFG